jgi:6-phosphogluconolactonase
MSERVAIERIGSRAYASAVADEIVASIGESIEDHGSCSLVLAGGGTPSTIYRLLARPPRASEVSWHNVHLFWGDERWVGGDDNQSNYHMAQETLLSHIRIPAENLHRINTSLESPQHAAAAYEAEIRRVLGCAATDVPVFDLVLLGVGKDGHTASLFPNSEVLEQRGTVCHAVGGPDGHGYRVTLSPDVLVSARRVLFIVTGRGKAEVVKRVLEGSESYRELPAKISERVSGRVTWFLDMEASQELEIQTG